MVRGSTVSVTVLAPGLVIGLAACLAACRATGAGGSDDAGARRAGEPVSALEPLAPDESGTVLRCGTVLTMNAADEILRPGMVALKDGRIRYVGPWAEVPEGWEVHDFPAGWATPGLVELHSHVQTGSWGDINEMVIPVNPEFSTRPTIRPSNPNVRRACAGGVTTLFGIPGSGTSMSGFGVLYKTKTHATYGEAVLADPGGLKVAQTHNPERRAGDLGLTRAGLSWMLSDYMDKAGAVTPSEPGEPGYDPALDGLARVRTGELPVLIHCAGGQGVGNTVHMWKDNYDTRCVVSHGSFTGWKVARYAAERGVPVNHGPRTMDYWSTREGRIVGSGAEYVAAGVPDFSLNTDAGVIPQEELFLQGSMSARLGADSYQMLRAVTINPAASFGIEDRVGSLEPGKQADVVVHAGDPLDPRSRVELVLIDGRVQYDVQSDGQWF